MSPKTAVPEAEAAFEPGAPAPEFGVPEAEAEVEPEAEAAPVEGAISPPFIIVEHADGQQSVIPVDYGCCMQIIDPFGVVKATVGFAGVNSLELVL